MMLLTLLITLTVDVLVLPLSMSENIEMKGVKLGETAVLKCNISLHHEIFWLKVNMKEKPRLLLVARLKNDGGLTEVLNYNASNLEGCLVEKLFGLRIFKVLKSDLGSYFCGTVDGKRMEFGDGVHVYGNALWRDKVAAESEVAAESKVAVTEKRSFTYPIFAAVLGVGQVGMVLVVFIVHVIFWKKKD